MKGTGNQQDYGMRIYDPRLGRFLSIDPLTASYPWWSPYQFAGNNPIQQIDVDGLEGAVPPHSPQSTPKLGIKNKEAVLKLAEIKSNAIHNLIQDLDLPPSYKQPYNNDGTPSADYSYAYQYLSKSISVDPNKVNYQDLATDALGAASDMKVIDKLIEKPASNIGDKLAKQIVRGTMVKNGVFSSKAVNTFILTSKVGANVVSGPISIAIDVMTGNEVGTGSSLTERREQTISTAMKSWMNRIQPAKTGPLAIDPEIIRSKSDATVVVESPK